MCLDNIYGTSYSSFSTKYFASIFGLHTSPKAALSQPFNLAPTRIVHKTSLYTIRSKLSNIDIFGGLNGLLLGVAKERDLDAICLMGEIPYYLQGTPWPYPKASISVIEVLSKILEIEIGLKHLEQLAKKIEQNIDDFLQTLYNAEGVPPELKEHIEGLRHAKQAGLGPITEEEQKKIVEHIDELFRGEEGSGKRHV